MPLIRSCMLGHDLAVQKHAGLEVSTPRRLPHLGSIVDGIFFGLFANPCCRKIVFPMAAMAVNPPEEEAAGVDLAGAAEEVRNQIGSPDANEGISHQVGS